ncbi:MAG: hypothetical protein ABIZ72_03700, partial [Candidatus Limnocylindrales bacterium]
ELPLRMADRDELGLALARSLLIADQLLEESAGWLWIGGRIPDPGERASRGAELIARYETRLAELLGEPATRLGLGPRPGSEPTPAAAGSVP